MPVPTPDASAPSYSPPLTIADKTAIKAYLVKHGYSQTDIDTYIASFSGGMQGGIFGGSRYWSRNSLSGQPWSTWDSGLLQAYEAVVSGGGFGKAGTHTKFSPSLPFSSDLEKWAVRIGEALAGLLLVGIGINAMTKQRGRSSGGITRTVRTARKVAKVVK